MTVRHQIVFNCADPHALVRFWAAAMDLEIEQHGDFVQRMVDHGMADVDDTVVIDGVLQWADAAACSSSDSTTRLLFQRVADQKVGPNRVHLDLHVDDRDAAVTRLVDLGASRPWDGSQGPLTWVTLADPEGNELCVS